MRLMRILKRAMRVTQSLTTLTLPENRLPPMKRLFTDLKGRRRKCGDEGARET